MTAIPIMTAIRSGGWYQKMQPCPPDLERMLPPPPPNYAHVVIGGDLVRLNRANLQIDVFHLEIN